MHNKNHLSIYGIGPTYTISIVVLTIAGIILSNHSLLESGKISALYIPFIVIGSILIIFGIILWLRANFESKIFKNIKSNSLVTSGVYSLVRNPIYSAISMICIGILFFENNLWLLVLPFIFWGLLTTMLKATEEKWLYELYGDEFLKYCGTVNRCIPWFKKKIYPYKKGQHH